ncbi:MAG: SCO family protein [Candidatus Neomarinimicrobiota bacterium]|tara:strand:+ start:2448 stop:3029 length:582 start_codon:yes stop_codon:yes gene_type:complete
MNQKIRFIIYGIVAVMLLVTFLFKESITLDDLPISGSVPDFEFTDSNGETITREDMEGKVWVADFIFTTCTMACPIMTGNMNLIHKSFKDDNNVRIISISVYPEYDTPEVLKEYASRYNANTDRWHFLTGPEESVKNIIKTGFKIGDYEDIIFHSEKFALVDVRGNIRGYYSGMETEDMSKLKKDIKRLLRES